MKFHGGYNICLAGRPGDEVEVLPEPEVLYLPLESSRLTFTEVAVREGQRVLPGQVLAKDPGNYAVGLLAPRAGVVRLAAAPGHITLEDVEKVPEEAYEPDGLAQHIERNMGSTGIRRYKLLSLGAWQFFHDAHTGDVPDPFARPRAVIVSTLKLGPYETRGDVLLHKRLPAFIRGLEHIQSLLEYQPIYLALPDIRSEFAQQVRDAIRGYAWVKMIQAPMTYPFGHLAVLARTLGLKRQAEPVWGLDVGGVLAVDRALTLSHPATVRIVSLAGPGVISPVHLKAMPGYPLEQITASRLIDGDVRIVNGGMLSGRTVASDQRGLDVECSGLTVLAEQTEREFLGFIRPGSDRVSYSRCFVSLFVKAPPERRTTGLRGEGRPCIGCGYCEEVCPVGVMPHLLHKLLYRDELEEAGATGLNRCIGCGLCSFVCPSKLDLREEFLDARQRLAAELAEAAAELAAAEEAAAAAEEIGAEA